MKQQLFRKKSLDRVSSPEQLNDYIRVSSPGVWLTLCAIIILLVGVCIWGVLGHLDTKLSVACQVEKGQMIGYVKETDLESVKTGMTLECQNQEYEITSIESKPSKVTADMDSYLIHVGGLQSGEWVYQITTDANGLDEGVYEGQIIIDRVAPVSFVLN